MATATPTDSYLVVTAIDFGTAYSGYAFSLRHDPMKVQIPGWIAGSDRLISYKTPTCVLVNPEKKFDSFGFEAENKYYSLAQEEMHHDWMFFKRFKMMLHNPEGLSRNTEVEAVNGKRMLAMDVFTMAIEFMREHLMRAVTNQVAGIQETDVMFVITVPAIWTDASKQFMRKAAIAAGINNDRIKLALEPEAASILCQHTVAGNVIKKTGSKYMVVDMGDGTADVTVHEKNLDKTLKELRPPSGGPWGGNYVDENYIKWMTEFFGEATMKQFKDECIDDFIDMLREFEIRKRNVFPDTQGFVVFKISPNLQNCHNESEDENILTRIARLNLGNGVKIKKDKLHVSVDIVRSWFKEPIDNAVGHVKSILSEPAMKDICTILLVGGFGECQLVQEAVRKAAGTRTVLTPEDAGLAVLKGAVQFGHQPRMITSRCMKYTYGFLTQCQFDERKHPLEKMAIDSYGEKKVYGCFEKIVSRGESVDMCKEVKFEQYVVDKGKFSTLSLYSSTKQDPEFTNDPTCTLIGKIDLPIPPGDTKEENSTNIYFTFGDTELKASVEYLKTGQVLTKVIDCL